MLREVAEGDQIGRRRDRRSRNGRSAPRECFRPAPTPASRRSAQPQRPEIVERDGSVIPGLPRAPNGRAGIVDQRVIETPVRHRTRWKDLCPAGAPASDKPRRRFAPRRRSLRTRSRCAPGRRRRHVATSVTVALRRERAGSRPWSRRAKAPRSRSSTSHGVRASHPNSTRRLRAGSRTTLCPPRALGAGRTDQTTIPAPRRASSPKPPM